MHFNTKQIEQLKCIVDNLNWTLNATQGDTAAQYLLNTEQGNPAEKALWCKRRKTKSKKSKRNH